jgi:general secretion pathway protein A
MYTAYFHLAQPPFSIAPDPRYLFMSERHREALAHLLYGIDAGGGIVLLSGEIGTGKTTLCRCLLEQVPATCNIAYVFNPKLTVTELLETICAEFHVALAQGERRNGTRAWTEALNRYLLAQHAAGRHSVLVIDEAQNLAPEVLEQLRLLTNLETNERKLLQIILIGQPELRAMLGQAKLEQMAQRVVAHYHLGALNEQETASYVQQRLATAGLNGPSPFAPAAMRHIHRLSGGVPRRINLLCDRALLGAYAQGVRVADRRIVEHAAAELFIGRSPAASGVRWRRVAFGVAGAAAVAVAAATVGTQVVATGSPASAVRAEAAPVTAAAAEAGEAAEALPSREPIQENRIAQPQAALAVHAVQTMESAEQDKQAAPAFAGIGDEPAAMRELAALWGWSGSNGSNGDPCADQDRAALRCYRSSGGLAELRQLDRPAVLRLYDNAKQPYFALLVGLDESSVRLQAGSTQQEVDLGRLTRHFRGEFTTLWRNAAGSGTSVALGQHGPAVDWVGQQLARVHAAELPAARQPYNLELLRQVRLFQQAHGLSVDGVVGPVTFMHLNRVAGLREPRLLAAAGD